MKGRAGKLKMHHHYTIPIFVPHRACPFRCIFCDQEKISGRKAEPDAEGVRKTIEEHLSTIPRDGSHVEIGFFGGTFTGISREDQAIYLGIAKDYKISGKIRDIRLSTRPDFIDEKILAFLKEYGVGTIELGAQSLDDEVLIRSARGHTVQDIGEASALIRNHGFRLGLQLMVGLPGDSREIAVNSAKNTVRLGASDARIYPVVVIRGTRLEEMYHSGKYDPLPLDEAASVSADMLKILEDGGVNVIRIGLHPSEGLLSGHELVAGPFHPSFREIVMTRIWEDQFLPLLKEKEKSRIIVTVPAEQLNFAIGHRSSNRKMLLKTFRRVIFVPDPTLEKYEYRYHFG